MECGDSSPLFFWDPSPPWELRPVIHQVLAGEFLSATPSQAKPVRRRRVSSSAAPLGRKSDHTPGSHSQVVAGAPTALLFVLCTNAVRGPASTCKHRPKQQVVARPGTALLLVRWSRAPRPRSSSNHMNHPKCTIAPVHRKSVQYLECSGSATSCTRFPRSRRPASASKDDGPCSNQRYAWWTGTNR